VSGYKVNILICKQALTSSQQFTECESIAFFSFHTIKDTVAGRDGCPRVMLWHVGKRFWHDI